MQHSMLFIYRSNYIIFCTTALYEIHLDKYITVSFVKSLFMG